MARRIRVLQDIFANLKLFKGNSGQ